MTVEPSSASTVRFSPNESMKVILIMNIVSEVAVAGLRSL
jgi:hypothetical protein